MVTFLPLFSVPASAEISVDFVRDALAQDDYSGLEQEFTAAHQLALQERDFTQLRHVYSILFVTANQDRLSKAENWLELYPSSPYAATALAWSHHYRAYLLRGSAPFRYVSPEAGQAFHDELMRAKELTDHAMSVAMDFLPAVDASIALKRTHVDDGAIPPLVDHELNIAPDRHAVELGLFAAEMRWGGDWHESMSLCGFMADRAPDYDAELCMISVVFRNEMKGLFREKALEVLETRDEDFLDYARLDAYLNEWRHRDGAAEDAMRIHQESLGPSVGVTSYMEELQRISTTFQRPFYGLEAKEALIAVLRERLADNPQSLNILRVLIDDVLTGLRAGTTIYTVHDAQALWYEMLPLGAYRSDTWRLGGEIHQEASGGLAADSQRPFIENAIYYSNHSPFELAAYILHLFQGHLVSTGEISLAAGVDIDPKTLGESVRCPMFRATRLFKYICEVDSANPGCNIGGYGADFPDRIVSIMKRSQDCEFERISTIEKLLFTPIPAEHFLEAAGK